MIKSDLANLMIDTHASVTQRQAEAVVETIFRAMKDALISGENIEIRGLGAFHVKRYGSYQGRNPKTGEPIMVRPKRGLVFRPGKELKERVNNGKPVDALPVVENPSTPSDSE